MRPPFDFAGPLMGGAGEDRYYSTRLRQLLRIELDETSARALWNAVGAHRGDLARRLGRDVGQRVALLDYVTNVSPRLVDPLIIEGNTLEAIERSALLDPLTGLYNRAYFDAALPREIARCERTGEPSALMLMDLDRFKAVNDGEGHRAGDEVLRNVSEIVREQVRTMDVPCRFGGDELAAILTNAPDPVARQVAERIREAVAVAHRGRTVEVTVSIGLAPLLPVSHVGETLKEEPFISADRALYVAKRSGGNRVIDAFDPEALTGGRPLPGARM